MSGWVLVGGQLQRGEDMSGPHLHRGLCAAAYRLDQEIDYAVVVPTLRVFKSVAVYTQDLFGLVDECLFEWVCDCLVGRLL